MNQTILDCGHEPSQHGQHTTGYGVDAEGRKHCYQCCADQDRASMIETGRATLYLCVDGIAEQSAHRLYGVSARVTNWPNSLSFPVRHMCKGSHNIARTRYDAWFNGPDGFVWHAVNYGENSQIAHCKRTKERTGA